MVNDRMMVRVGMLFVLAAWPALTSAQSIQSVQPKVQDWRGKEVTQISIEGSSQQLKAFKEELPANITKGLADQTVFLSPTSKKKLVYSYLTETETKLGEPTLPAFYSALKASTEKTKDAKPPVMRTSIFASFSCRPGSCSGQQARVGRVPPCDC